MTGGRDEPLRRQVFGYLGLQPHTPQSGGGEDGAVGFVAGGLAEAGFYVAADGDYGDIGGVAAQLGGAAGAAGADAGAGGQLRQRQAPAVDQRIAGILAGQHRAQGQAVAQGRGHILQAMHRQIQIARPQPFLQFADEHAQAHPGEGGGGVGVAAGADGHHLELQPRMDGL